MGQPPRFSHFAAYPEIPGVPETNPLVLPDLVIASDTPDRLLIHKATGTRYVARQQIAGFTICLPARLAETCDAE